MQQTHKDDVTDDPQINCLYCDRQLSRKAIQRGSMYCRTVCAVDHKRLGIPKFEVRSRKAAEFTETSWIKYTNLYFTNEKEFSQWFATNYAEFGILELLEIREAYPDIRAKMYTGEVIWIELEYIASRFNLHRDRASECDLVISFMCRKGTKTICGVPVISVFEISTTHRHIKNSYETRELSNFFKTKLEEASRRVIETIARRNIHSNNRPDI